MVAILYTVGTIFFTWPLAPSLATHTPSHIDPPFSAWRLAWIARQLTRGAFSTTELFDGNVFWPAHRTLAYSDATLLQGVIATPLMALGLSAITVLNLLTLAAMAGSGAAAYLLARRLTGHTGGSLVAGMVFAFAPYRIDHLAHLELQWAFWMPLAFWAWHRAHDGGRLRDGLLCGLFVTLQLVSSIYYGLFLGVALAALGAFSLLARRRLAIRAVAGLAAGVLLLGVVAALYSKPYRMVQARMGDRSVEETRRYSATWTSFVSTRVDNRLYGATGKWTEEEKRLFPGLTPLVLAGAALWPPVAAGALVYIGVLAVAGDAALGLNGRVFVVLREWVPGFAGLRAPARFGAVVQLCLGVLAAMGVARLAHRWPRRGTAVTALAMVLVSVEYAQRPAPLMRVFTEVPPIYTWLAKQPPGTVTLELPVPSPAALPRLDPLFMYYSTWHWQPLANGYSGHYATPYLGLLEAMKRFPGPEAEAALLRGEVQIVIVHKEFFAPDQYAQLIAQMDANPRFALMNIANDTHGEARAYAFLPAWGPRRTP